MQVDEYKAMCQHPDVFSRSTLEETVRVLQTGGYELMPLIERTLLQPPLEKPCAHVGDATTDFFRVAISASEAEAIRDACIDEEVASVVGPEGYNAALARYYGKLADLWTDYIIFIEDGFA